MLQELPRWNARLNISRQFPNYADLMKLVGVHFSVHQELESFLGPYNARQRSQKIYRAPTRDDLKSAVRQRSMNDISYNALLSATIRFCEQTHGLRALPTPHPSVIHSIQLPQPAFVIDRAPAGCKMGTHQLLVSGAEPIYIQALRASLTPKFVIIRPRLSKLGTPSVKDWEILLFDTNHGYIPNWVDSAINPRFAGIYH